MYEIVKNILTSPMGSFGSMFAIVCLILFLTYKSGKIVEKFNLVKIIQDSIDKIKEDIAEIKGFIQVFKQDSSRFAQSSSPINLSELGSEVSKDLHIERIIKNDWEKLNKKIKSLLKEDTNPYNIQEVCFALGDKYFGIVSEEDLDAIKKYAFSKGYNLSDFDIVFGIVLRDIYFKEEGIDVVDVDAHDPAKKQNDKK
ncbi:MAG: hypothetical protein KAT48_14050 [Bacteroidales bacterium]|nr:hypothetical protein [Candidatus Parcubacteria bacterium]MCK4679252.1 hypothetical protein [Bacteroidales bacterium]